MNMSIEPHAPRYARRPDIFFTIVDDELILMGEDGERFFSSNAIASTIWDALDTPVSVDALCDTVLSRYTGASHATVQSDVVEFLGALSERDLIRAVEAG